MPRRRKPVKEHPIPEGRENESAEWVRAFNHAKANGNNDKAAAQYADSHAQDDEFADEEDGETAEAT